MTTGALNMAQAVHVCVLCVEWCYLLKNCCLRTRKMSKLKDVVLCWHGPKNHYKRWPKVTLNGFHTPMSDASNGRIVSLFLVEDDTGLLRPASGWHKENSLGSLMHLKCNSTVFLWWVLSWVTGTITMWVGVFTQLLVPWASHLYTLQGEQLPYTTIQNHGALHFNPHQSQQSYSNAM